MNKIQKTKEYRPKTILQNKTETAEEKSVRLLKSIFDRGTETINNSIYNRASILSLPKEIHLHVFRYLNDRDIYFFSLACTSTASIGYKSLRIINFNEFSEKHNIGEILTDANKKYQNLAIICKNFEDIRPLTTCLDKLPHLYERLIELDLSQIKVTPDNLLEIASFLEKIHNLRTLKFGSIEGLHPSKPVVIDLSDYGFLEGLSYLSFEGIKLGTVAFPREKQLSDLTELHFKGDIIGSTITLMRCEFPKLVHLTFKSIEDGNIPDNGSGTFISFPRAECPKLAKINFNGTIKGVFIDLSLCIFPNLQCLTFWHIIGSCIMFPNPTLPNLKRLHFEGAIEYRSNFPINGICLGNTTFPKLSILTFHSLKSNDLSRSNALILWPKELPNLKKLAFSDSIGANINFNLEGCSFPKLRKLRFIDIYSPLDLSNSVLPKLVFLIFKGVTYPIKLPQHLPYLKVLIIDSIFDPKDEKMPPLDLSQYNFPKLKKYIFDEKHMQI